MYPRHPSAQSSQAEHVSGRVDAEDADEEGVQARHGGHADHAQEGGLLPLALHPRRGPRPTRETDM